MKLFAHYSSLGIVYSTDLNIETFLNNEISRIVIGDAFFEYRCFPFFPSLKLVNQLKNSKDFIKITPMAISIKNKIIKNMSEDNSHLQDQFIKDIHLSSRIVNSIILIHLALSQISNSSLLKRRFVLIKEKIGEPGILHLPDQLTVMTHIGPGPHWKEMPTIYLGLNLLQVLYTEEKKKEQKYFNIFKKLLVFEEKAIETGYIYTEQPTDKESIEFLNLFKKVMELTPISETTRTFVTLKKRIKRFTSKTRQHFYEKLNARLKDNIELFDDKTNIKAIQELERLARQYKENGDNESLKEIVKIAVAASGHDVPEVRNKANIVLERIFSPKEYEAPLAINFLTVHKGETNKFSFNLPRRKNPYFLRIYYGYHNDIPTLENIYYKDYKMSYNEKSGNYELDHTFNNLGYYDFVVLNEERGIRKWMNCPDCSGRVNVIPNVRGHIILEIFPDIHGHTRIFWWDDKEHPGLVYNENGEVIRLGNFSDITAHLEYIKSHYYVTELYLLGVQKRGYNREDWAPGATSPSPFSPMSLVKIEPSLGGEKEFIKLIKKAHSLDIKIIVDIVPHVNRKSTEVPNEWVVKCYDEWGNLVDRAATDGRYGSWNDGKLLNYRKFEVWEWLADSILTLIEKFDIDGVRFDSAHAVPIMMKRNNYPYIYNKPRTNKEMLEGSIIINDKEDDHFITTGYYDSICRDVIAPPFHHYLMSRIFGKLKDKNKNFFINIAECYWGREKYLTRSGIIPYNSALFKICENITHKKANVGEIYHLYNNYFPAVLPKGTELLGIFGNHDENRPIHIFGHWGYKAAIMLTSFMNNIILDYEGNPEGEGWKVYLDNIFVNWNQFEQAANRSLEPFYRRLYSFHRKNLGKGYLISTTNSAVVGTAKFCEDTIWIGAFNFSDQTQHVELIFDNSLLPLKENNFFKIIDPLYSHITGKYGYITTSELRVSKISTIVPFIDRIKLLQLETVENPENEYINFIRDSFLRILSLDRESNFRLFFTFNEIASHSENFKNLSDFITKKLLPIFQDNEIDTLILGLKRIFFYIFKYELISSYKLKGYFYLLSKDENSKLRDIGKKLINHNKKGNIVFISAEAIPFSKSGGLANVVYELPRELVKMHETVYVITPLYRSGNPNAVKKMNEAIYKYKIKYTGINIKFAIGNNFYEAGVHSGEVDGIKYYLLDHYELFDGLYWGYTAEEKLKRRIALARASAEIIIKFNLKPLFTFTNDAFAGVFNGIVRSDSYYINNENFKSTSFFHIIHNGNWQYFDSYFRYENGIDLYHLFNLPYHMVGQFLDPNDQNKINCMAIGVRFSDMSITVSPSYAKQIKIASDGLEKILGRVVGINNAIGRDFPDRVKRNFESSGFVDKYYPMFIELIKNDNNLIKKIKDRYPEILDGPYNCELIRSKIRRSNVTRVRNKLLLQTQKGLKIDPDAVLFTMIHRISEQKGFHLLLEASETIFRNFGFQGIIGGPVAPGDKIGEEIAKGLINFSDYYKNQVSVNIGFQDISAPLLASDLFIMPSLYEPGGISQLEALSCGCLVVARATGGLRDTIHPIKIKGYMVDGNGFLFTDYDAHSFSEAMQRALLFFKNTDERIQYRARQNAIKSVYYWDESAKKYVDTIYSFKEIIPTS